MESTLIFYPAIAQMLLTFAMYFKLAIVKQRALENGEVDLERRALHGDAWPVSVMKISNNLQNQFESPVLFYALCFMLWALGAVTLSGLLLAWGFVVLRVMHSFVHTGANVVPIRKKIFMASTVMLMVLCAYVVLALLAS